MLSSYILGEDKGSLDGNLKDIIRRMREFQHQFCEGVPKVRLMKLLFAEVAELKAVGFGFDCRRRRNLMGKGLVEEGRRGE